jgi:CSLREA domain-containing protein
MRRSATDALLALMVAGLATLLFASSASAVTYTVNSIGDQPDESVGAEGCKTSVGNCTLRAAIEESNASTSVDDLVIFSALFNGESLGTISLTAGLPKITDSLVIEGKSCTTEAAGATGPCVGVKIPGNAVTMQVEAPDVTIEGLAVSPVITAFSTGIAVRAGSPRFKATGLWLGKPLSGALNYLQTGAEVDSSGIGSAADRAQFTDVFVEGSFYGVFLAGPGALIAESAITGGAVGVQTSGANGGIGARIESSSIRGNVFDGVRLANGDNTIVGSEINNQTGSGILVEGSVSGNVIGGELASEENFIASAGTDAIKIKTDEASQNEVGRNRGAVSGSFLKLELFGAGTAGPNGGIQPPPIAAAFESSARGTGAAAGARVRVFSTTSEAGRQITAFLGSASADASGNWRAIFSTTVSADTTITATQTNTLGGTSELAAVASVAVDPPCPSADAVGCTPPPTPLSGCPAVPSACPPAASPTPPDKTKPKVTIKKAPKAKSTATTAKFVFSSNEKSTFKCKLDKKAWAKCKSPKTYRKLKLGKHVFKVKATDATGNVSAVLTRKFRVVE